MVDQLGKLERIDDLRSVWPNEAADFTPWLQQNIGLLSEALGLDIQLVEREVAVGDFSVDLIGEEPGTSRPVIIENQLERTNHDHLGKLLTYSAGRGGGVIIWVAKEIRPEHRNALDWLNNATQGNIDFYGVELELLRIGSSAMAPNFNVVVAPKITGSYSSSESGTPTSERQLRYQAFFEDMLGRIKLQRPGVTNRNKIGFASWLTLPSGKAGFGFGLSFVTGSKFMFELYIDKGIRAVNKNVFDVIHAEKDSIEDSLGGVGLSWQRLENRRASRVAWYWDTAVTIMDPPDKLEDLKKWALANYFRFWDTLSPYLDNLPSSFEETELDEVEGRDSEGLAHEPES